MKKIGMAILAVAMTLQGCSDPKKASKANFEIAFENFMKTQPSTGLCYRLRGFDKETSSIKLEKTSNEDTSTIQLLAAYDVLVQNGLFNQPTITPNPSRYSSSTEYVFTLTSSATKLLSTPKNPGPFDSSAPALCVGQFALDEVVRWSEPADKNGVKVSVVSYKGHYENLPDWTRVPQINGVFPNAGKKINGSFEFKALAMLMSDGWEIGTSDLED